jgi:hypothetical protein
MGPAFDLPTWLEDLGAEDLGVTPKRHATLRLPTGAIVACDPVVFLDGAEPFSTKVPPGEYPVELGLTDEGLVAYALVRFSDETITSWDAGLFANRDAPRLGLPVYPADSGAGCFLDAEAASALVEQGQDHFEKGARWVDSQEVDAEDDDAWHAAFEKYETEHPPPIAKLEAGDIVDIDGTKGNLVTFRTGKGDGTYATFWGLDASGAPACLLTDFKLIGVEETDDDLMDPDLIDEEEEDDDDDGDGDDVADADWERDDDDHGALDALLKLVQGGPVSAREEPEPAIDSPFVVLATQTLDHWETDGVVELEEDASRDRFVDAFADFLASEPTPKKLEEWLFDQDAIAEVYADGDTLWRSLRDQAREAKSVTHRRA